MFNSWLNLLSRELAFIYQDRVVRRFFLIAPLLVGVLFAALYYQGQIMEIPTVICDQDQSSLSREIIAAFDNHPRLQVVARVSSYSGLENMIMQEQARVGVVIPTDLEDKASHGQSTQVLTIVDGSNLVYSNYGLSASSEVINDLSSRLGVSLLSRAGYFPEQTARVSSSLNINEEVWYNSALSYAYFLIFAFIIFILQQTFLIGSCQVVSRETANNSWQKLKDALPGWCLLPSKVLPYWLIGMMQLALILLTGRVLLGLPVNGSIICLVVLSMIFFAVLAAFALLVSQLTVPLNSLRFTMFIALPSLALSGYTWPLFAMPALIRGISYALPLTWFLDGFQAITVRGAGWTVISQPLLILAIMLLLYSMGNYAVWKITNRRQPTTIHSSTIQLAEEVNMV